MNPPEAKKITPFQRMDGEPVFDEPWQAQVLAMVDALVGSEVITPGLWSDSLSAALKDAESRGEADTIDTYYRAALQALEKLLDHGGEVSAAEATQRRDDWEQAYLQTPHGQPVNLEH